ncbi:5-formyltetrahydrofolate cyclo-ligase [soil metagenome]
MRGEDRAVREAKATLRRRLLAARRTLAPADHARMSRGIAERLYGLQIYRDARTVHLYVGAIGGEVATRDIVEESLAEGKRVFCPRVARGPDRIETYGIRSLDDLGPGIGGLWEPDPDRAPPGAIDEIDLVVVPGIAFDRQGWRIGFGAGFYDRFLGGLQSESAALAFSLQLMTEVPHSEQDIPVDWIVTEAETIDCRTEREASMRDAMRDTVS